MHKFKGKVQTGHKRGKRLGFPTANIALPSPIDEGIYISWVRIDKKYYRSLTFIGAAKTFGDTEVFSETWIMDFDKDIYGQEIEVELIEKIRENMKFTSETELIKQMEDDKTRAIEYFTELDSKQTS